MDFTLSKEHEMARQLFKEFAENEVKPLAQEVDETETFPPEQPVLLRLIPQALPICNDFGVPVLVSRFQIIGPFLRILVDGEEKLDLLFLILEVIVLIGDNGHDLLFIQKSGQLWAVRFLCI